MAQEPKGNKIVAFKDYRREVPASDVVKFVDEILSGKARSFGSSQIPPIVHHKDVTYVWKKGDKGSNVIAVAATKWDSNVLAIQELLHQLLDLLRMFCPSGNILSNTLALSSDDKLKADALRAKHALVLSILEEVVDFGYPQVTHAESLCELVIDTPTLEGKTVNALDALLRRRKKDPAVADGDPRKIPTLDVTGAVPWRKPGILYKKNEVYLDAIEKVSALVASDGALISGRVQGSIQMKVYLSGMPECKIGLNEKFMMEAESGYKTNNAPSMEGRPTSVAQKACRSQVALDYIKFHQAVKLQNYEAEHQVHFVPPDGEFELLSYHVSDTSNFTLPFTVTSNYKSLGRTRAEMNVKLKADFPSSLVAFQVIAWMPLPKSTVKVNMSATGGKTKSKYVELDKNQMHWKLSELRGGKEHKFKAIIEMMAATELKGEERSWEKPPIRLTFQVPMFTATGLRIRFLKVHEKSGYQPVKWVRYLTTAGDDYEVRIAG
jgi:AP-2 complex subunit mu-1